MVERAEWLIRKGEYFYRPNCQGYTIHKHEAGRYTKEKAEAEASVEPWRMKAIHEDEWPDDAVSTNYKDKDARIAELAAENERLARELAGAHTAIRALHGTISTKDEALSRTGAVKVPSGEIEDIVSDLEYWSERLADMRQPQGQSSLKHAASILSALEPAARETSPVASHEAANVREKPAAPEAQQEPVEMEAMVQAAWFAYWSKELKGLDEGDMNRMRAALKAAMEAGK